MSYTPRIEEYHVLGMDTYQEFKLDKLDIVAYSSEFDGNFESEFLAKITAATGIATTKFYIAELSALSKKIKEDTKLVFPKLNFLEGYIKLAKNDISKEPKMFGIKAVRDAARAENAEKLRLAFDTVFANVEKPGDFDKIKAKGLKDADYANLKALAMTLVDDNDAQEFYKTEKATAIQENGGLFKDLLDTIKKVQEVGKILYKFTNKAKLDAYTMAVLIRRIRQDEPHTLICGVVKSAGNELASKIKVVARMSDGTGRTKTVYTNSKGYYELRGMKAGAYDITFTMTSGKVFTLKAEAVTNEEVKLDAKEPAV
jgi:hypothetical protein